MSTPSLPQVQRGSATFLLASLASAVGQGNVWRFSYVVGENGRGAFLLVYMLVILLVGLPLMLAECALGRSTQRETVAAIRSVAPVLQPGATWAGYRFLSPASSLRTTPLSQAGF